MMSRSRSLLTIALFATLTPIAGCHFSSPLTKEEAGGLISKAEPFNRAKFARIPRQIDIVDRYNYSTAAPTSLSMEQLSRHDPTVAILKARGLIEVADMAFTNGEGLLTRTLRISPTAKLDTTALEADEADDEELTPLTPRAMRERAQETVQLERRGLRATPGWRMPIGTRVFGQVTEIHNWKDKNIELQVNELAIDFTWTWHPTEAGDPFDSESAAFASLPEEVQDWARRGNARMNTSAPRHSRAFLKRAGKNWVLQEITWSIGNGDPS
jgi:hypothetical protein